MTSQTGLNRRRAFIMRVPSEHFTVVVLSNAASYGPADRAKRIADVYLGDKIPPSR